MADFGLFALPEDAPGDDRIARYRATLDLLPPEFTTVWVSDHFQLGEEPRVDGWTFLTYLAALFQRFRFGHLVLAQSYRNPALLGKMAATLQELTGGRYILGIGAGWNKEEYDAYGYDYPSGGVRVEQLAEAIQVMRALWTESPATFHGQHYRIENAYCVPQPDPPIPIMVGTNGPKALRVVAQFADWWSWDGPWENVYRRPYELLEQHCQEIGRPFQEITLTSQNFVWFPDDVSRFERTFEHTFYPGQIFEQLGPTPEDAIADLRQLVDAGVSHFQIAAEDMRTLRLFVDEVVPAFR